LQTTAWLHLLVALVLGLAAVVEAVTVIWALPRLA